MHTQNKTTIKSNGLLSIITLACDLIWLTCTRPWGSNSQWHTISKQTKAQNYLCFKKKDMHIKLRKLGERRLHRTIIFHRGSVSKGPQPYFKGDSYRPAVCALPYARILQYANCNTCLLLLNKTGIQINSWKRSTLLRLCERKGVNDQSLCIYLTVGMSKGS